MNLSILMMVFLESLHLLNDVDELLEVVGWCDYMTWDKPMSSCVGSF